MVRAPMAGVLLRFEASVGDEVRPDQDVAVLESMKMEIPVQAGAAGRVAATHAEPGRFVNQGDPLVTLE